MNPQVPNELISAYFDGEASPEERATVESLLDESLALRMVIDVLWERGFHATVDIHRVEVPERVDPETWIIHCRTKKVYQIEVRYPPSDIRRGH